MTDITLNQDGDIEFSQGDILYDESSWQHQQDIIISNKGYYKESPATGIGVINFIHDNNPESFLRSIRKEFTRDGMKVKKVGIEHGQIKVEAEYENNHRKA